MKLFGFEFGKKHDVAMLTVKVTPDSLPRVATPSVATLQPTTAPCPYCGVILDPMPKRSRKCPHCGDPITIRTHRGKKFLLKVTQVATYDADLATLHARNAALRDARGIGADDEEFARVESQLLAKNPRYSSRDVFWQIANDHLRLAMQRGDWQDLHVIYFHQAYMLFQEGRDPYDLLLESHRCMLLHWETSESVVKKARIMTVKDGNTCPVCLRQDGKEFTLAEALRLMPIPPKTCTCRLDDSDEGRTGWCRNMWLPVMESR